MGLLKSFLGADDRTTLNQPKRKIISRRAEEGGRLGTCRGLEIWILMPSYTLCSVPVYSTSLPPVSSFVTWRQ